MRMFEVSLVISRIFRILLLYCMCNVHAFAEEPPLFAVSSHNRRLLQACDVFESDSSSWRQSRRKNLFDDEDFSLLFRVVYGFHTFTVIW